MRRQLVIGVQLPEKRAIERAPGFDPENRWRAEWNLARALQARDRAGIASARAVGRSSPGSIPSASATVGHTVLHTITSPLVTLNTSLRAAGVTAAHPIARATSSATPNGFVT